MQRIEAFRAGLKENPLGGYAEYDQLRGYLDKAEAKGKSGVKIANNTYIEPSQIADGVAIRLHDTQIIHVLPSGHYILDVDGYFTATTKDRIEMWVPVMITSGGSRPKQGYSGDILSYDAMHDTRYWEITPDNGGNSVLFQDGMVINPDGSFPSEAEYRKLASQHPYIDKYEESNTHDQNKLARIAKLSDMPGVIERAVKRIDDQKLLKEIALKYKSPTATKNAARRIKSQKDLLDIALNGPDASAEIAVQRLKNPKMLEKVMLDPTRQASEQAVREAVRRKYRVSEKTLLKFLEDPQILSRDAREQASWMLGVEHHTPDTIPGWVDYFLHAEDQNKIPLKDRIKALEMLDEDSPLRTPLLKTIPRRALPEELKHLKETKIDEPLDENVKDIGSRFPKHAQELLRALLPLARA